MTVLATGCAGFIGANFVRVWLAQNGETVVNLDKLTYAGNLANLDPVKDDSRHIFVHGDIADRGLVAHLLSQYRPRAVINFAAETHVDRSICGPGEFIATNVAGTFALLETVRDYWSGSTEPERESFRFLHVSTDEVYGALGSDDAPFRETDRYQPNSPYAASKAASDHLVRAWHKSFGLPVLTTNCSNNFGPCQFPEKLIPLVLLNALEGKPLPIYGDGRQVRDWLYVNDHCRAVTAVLARGRVGETYNIGGGNERANIEVVEAICAVLDAFRPRPGGGRYRDQIAYVADRPGHDRRYAIDANKITRELGWRPVETFDSALEKTVQWYLDHPDWIAAVCSGAYRQWIATHYGVQP